MRNASDFRTTAIMMGMRCLFASCKPYSKRFPYSTTQNMKILNFFCAVSFVVSCCSAFSTGTTADTVRDMLWGMTTYVSSMVDTSKQRFYSCSLPPLGERIHTHCPIRELGVAWDSTTVLSFWKNQCKEQLNREEFHLCQQRLRSATCNTLQVYSKVSNVQSQEDDGAMAVSFDILREPPNVAHSAFVTFVSIGALRLSFFQDPSTIPPINGLVQGILSMQHSNGAFCSQFGSDDIYGGIEFYPGEAMVALMEVDELECSDDPIKGIVDGTTRQAIVPTMIRAFRFYSDYYRTGTVDTNFHIWQVQAFARLYYALNRNTNERQSRYEAASVAAFVLDMCQDIINSRAWKELARGKSFYPNLETVEIACGLDAVAEGIRVALDSSEEQKAKLFWRNAENAVDFLKFVQDQVPPEATVGKGGLGYGGMQVLEQRLDVTGHAISALTKIYQVNDRCRV